MHYWFVADEEFDRMVADGELLEWALVHQSARYGTPAAPSSGLWPRPPAMLEIDLQGARQVRETMPEALFVFLKPPSGRAGTPAGRLGHRIRGGTGPPPGHRAGSSWPPRRSSTSPSSTTKFTRSRRVGSLDDARP